MTKLMLVFYTAANQKPFISLPTKTAISEHPPGLIDAVGKQVVTQTLPLIFTFLFQFDTVDGRSAEEGKTAVTAWKAEKRVAKHPWWAFLLFLRVAGSAVSSGFCFEDGCAS